LIILDRRLFYSDSEFVLNKYDPRL